MSEREREFRQATEALHQIASETWNVQYERGVLPQTVKFASRMHHLARAALPSERGRPVTPPPTLTKDSG